MSPYRLCGSERCPNPVRPGSNLCDDHHRERERKRGKRRREATGGVYKTKAWQMRRKQAIERQPLCPGVLGEPCPHNAIVDEVDHIVPLAQGGAPYDSANTRALCSSCHRAKTARENSCH